MTGTNTMQMHNVETNAGTAIWLAPSRMALMMGLRWPMLRWMFSISTVASSTDRKSTRLNSSHLVVSYAVFCLKKKNCANHLVSLARAPPRASHCHQRDPARPMFDARLPPQFFLEAIELLFVFAFFFFFNDTATTEIYPLSLHDALPILLTEESHFLELLVVDRISSVS